MSQNASKEKHRAAYAGIAGCVTPGGDFFVPHKGRPLLGCEKLLIQGLPYFRLALGNETEVQLGDLAGNAMSVTVVSACILASITSKQLRSEMQRQVDVRSIRSKKSAQEKKIREKFLEDVSKYMLKKGNLQNEVPASSELELEMPSTRESKSAKDVFSSLAKVANEAVTVSHGN